MQRTAEYTGPKTAIPPRFRIQRERVLKILGRWQRTTGINFAGSRRPRLTSAGPR